MKPIRDIAELTAGAVLYHSAFGFARVVAVQPERVTVEWDGGGENLPASVTHDVLQRVYALCEPGGFFERASTAREALAEQLQAQPSGSLAELLADLSGPQTPSDLRDWIVGRSLLTDAGFDRWWRMLQPLIAEDDRFTQQDGAIVLRAAGDPVGPAARLANPLLAPGRRLDIALAHRDTLGEEVFLDQVVVAWRTGGTQVRDLALSALADEPPERILLRLLDSGSDNIDALIHAIRHSSWAPESVPAAVHVRLADRVLDGCEGGGPLDAEGRLAATLHRWGSPGFDDALAEIAGSADGKRLLRATFTSMPPRRAEELGRHLLEHALGDDDGPTSEWLGGELLGFALLDQARMAARLEATNPALADWFRHEYVGVSGKRDTPMWDDTSDDTAYTAEIDLSDLAGQPIPLSHLPARTGASLLGLGLAIARALSVHHKDGRVVNPTADRVRVLPDETVEADASDDEVGMHRPAGERPSTQRDVYAAAVLLLEVLFGRGWPRDVPPHRAIPYLRTVVDMLPPSSVAPLETALHVDPALRPPDGLAWLAQWQNAAVAEENRSYMAANASARLRIGFDSHIGRMKVLLTQTNQDAVFVSTKASLSLLLVCDGISTANAGSGDVASSIACHVIANLWEQAVPRLSEGGPADHRDFLDRALRAANTAVCEAAARFAGGDLDGRVPMGTTVVVALAHGNHVSLAWLGDSRAYLVGPFGASLLTADENQAGERLKAWHLHFLDRWEPAGFALVGYLGHFNELLRPEALPAHHASFRLSPGELLILCSDGVTDYAADTGPEVARLIADAARVDDPDEVARILVAHANRGGGGDNASCVVAGLI